VIFVGARGVSEGRSLADATGSEKYTILRNKEVCRRSMMTATGRRPDFASVVIGFSLPAAQRPGG
jgi:hypothetical protein